MMSSPKSLDLGRRENRQQKQWLGLCSLLGADTYLLTPSIHYPSRYKGEEEDRRPGSSSQAKGGILLIQGV